MIMDDNAINKLVEKYTTEFTRIQSTRKSEGWGQDIPSIKTLVRGMIKKSVVETLETVR